MSQRKNVLIVDDDGTNRVMLGDILRPFYDVYEACDGREGLCVLRDNVENISAVVLDLIMPNMDGYAFLEEVKNIEGVCNVPIIVATSDYNVENEKKIFKLGAWDFVAKPYDADILLLRLNNAIVRSEMEFYKKLKYMVEYDSLTGLYNRETMYKATADMLVKHKDKTFAFIRYDIDRFQLVNAYYGTKEGDDLLRYMAKTIKAIVGGGELSTYGRIVADVFTFCIEYDKNNLENMLGELRRNLEAYNKSYDIVPTFGIYIVDDNTLDISQMYDRATLAAKKAKGNYVDYFAYYTENLAADIMYEQEITNDMVQALNGNQFEVYMQPKFNLRSNAMCGAEALVRWNHPTKGVINPSKFTPILERNGYIFKLDYYVWEAVCKAVRKWIDDGKDIYPISVNVSRVDIYNPNFADIIIGLVESYNIPVHLIGLELTESAYTDNPIAMKETMTRLRNYGFTILMDDFGSGYSSLNMLKDIEVDVIKIDMNFLSDTGIKGRGENIIASVIRMAKWLKIPVVVEGVEAAWQAKFLKSIGCEYVQGFYFSKPVALDEYENMLEDKRSFNADEYGSEEIFDLDALFEANPQMDIMFSSLSQALAIFEFDGHNIDILKVNEGYYDLLNISDGYIEFDDVPSYIMNEYRDEFRTAFKRVAANKDKAECEYAIIAEDGSKIWIRLSLKFIHEVSGNYLIMGTYEDITTQRRVDLELARYKAAVDDNGNIVPQMLIVDDLNVDRKVLVNIFRENYNIFEARDGNEAIDILGRESIDVILLDLIMPSMDGRQFLEYRKTRANLMNIPVVIITSDDRPEEQIATLERGVSDYIIKPFVSEVIAKRVENVMSANTRMKEIVKKYSQGSLINHSSNIAEIYNKVTAIKLINDILKDDPKACHTLVRIDATNFKSINETYGHIAGDAYINKLADELKISFRTNDIIGRMERDVFVVLMYGLGDSKIADAKCLQVQKKIKAKIHIAGESVSCTFNYAMFPVQGMDFEQLYERISGGIEDK